jgi:hypothetical protein
MVAFTPVRGGGHLLSPGDGALTPFQAAMVSAQLSVGPGGYRRICAELDVAWRVSDVNAELRAEYGDRVGYSCRRA